MSIQLSKAKRLLTLSSSVSTFATLIASSPALAQSIVPAAVSTETSAPAAADNDSAKADASAATAASSAAAGASADTIVVTARRRDEDAQDVPIALSVVGSQQLQASGSYTLNQIQQLVPTLQVFSFNPRNTNVNIRGLGSNVALTNDGLENGVGLYVDNVYYGRPGQSQFDLVDLAQIEVLRGPQGTLFGKNTTAGAINITTRPPSFTPEFSGEASLGNYAYHQVRGSVSAPIIPDVAAFRLSIADTHRDGLITNVYDGRKAQDYDNFTARAQLLVKPAADVSIKLIGDFSRQRQHFILNVPVQYFTTFDTGAVIPNNFIARVARAGWTPLPADPFARRGAADAHYQANMKTYGLSGQLDWKVGGATLTSVTAYRWWDWDPANDADNTPLSVNVKAQQVNRQRQFSQEVRLASSGTHRLDYVVGAYYFWQIVRGYGSFAYGKDAPLWFLPTVPAVVGNAALSGFEAHSTSNPETKSAALFGQATWKLTDALSLTGGLRYTHETKNGTFSQFWVAGADLSTLTAPQRATATGIRTSFAPVTSYDSSLKDDSVSGQATISWKVAQDKLLYALYSRGSKSGGLNLTVLPAGATAEVKPERVDNFEIGWKTQFFDRTLTFNAAAFLTKVKDYQTAVLEQNVTGAFIQYIANIPKVRSRGVELDLVYAPAKWLNLTAAGAYTDAKYIKYTNAPQAPEVNAALYPRQDLSGVQLAGVPKYSLSLGADVSRPVGGLGSQPLELYGHADFAWRSHFNTTSSNSRYGEVPGYGLLNGRVGLRADGQHWDLSLYVRNLLNKKYFQTLSVANTGLVTAILGEPRTYGVTLRTSW